MAYVPQWLTADSWNEVGRVEAAAGAEGWPEPVRRALETAQRYGLPAEIDGMFCPSDRGAPFTRVASASGPLWRLGRNDPLGGVEFVLDAEGRVHTLQADGSAEDLFVNSSLLAFLDALAAWRHRAEHLDDFDHLEAGDDEEDDPAEAARVAFGMAVRDRLRQQDPDAYPEVGTWWARVYEEVEYDAI